MKNQNYKLKDLIRIWMKACFNRALGKTGPKKSDLQVQETRRVKLNKHQKRGI